MSFLASEAAVRMAALSAASCSGGEASGHSTAECQFLKWTSKARDLIMSRGIGCSSDGKPTQSPEHGH